MASFYASYPVMGGSGGVPTYANLAAFPSAVGAGNGALAIALDTDILYISNGTTWEVLADPQVTQNAITGLSGDGTASGPGVVPFTLATVNVSPGTYGSASSVGVVTVNGKGLTTAGTSTAIQIAESQVTNLVSDLAGKQSTTLTNTHLLVGNVSNVATDVAAGGDLTLANTGAFTFNTVNSNVGSFGSASSTGTFTVNAKGLTTAAGSTAIQIAESQVTNLVSDLAAKQSTTLTDSHILVGSGANVATDVAMTGDIGISNTGVTAIQSGVIVNGDVNASAAIDYSKLAPLTSGNILVGSAGNVATSVPMSGDVSIIASGATTIANSAVTNAKIANGTIDLTTKVTGALPLLNGGTGTAAASANAAFNALSPMSASGDIIYGGTAGAGTRLVKGTDTQVLTLASGLPSWANPGALSATTGADADTAMTSASASIQIITPTANRVYTLPTTGIAQGQIYYFTNSAAVDANNFLITVNSSAGNLVRTIYPGCSGSVVALQATPTTGAHWRGLETVTSNWTPWTVTYSAGLGTVTNKTAYFRRVGDTLHARGYGSAGTLAGTIITLNLPAAASAAAPTIDFNKIPTVTDATKIGHFHMLNMGANNGYSSGFFGDTITDGSTTTSIFVSLHGNGGGTAYREDTGSQLGTGTGNFEWSFEVPIVGWTATNG